MFSLLEIIHIIITIVIAGYILQPLTKGKLKNSFVLAGISIVLHELGHKFVAIANGFSAVYHANFMGLGFGLLLRFFNMPIFMVPAYVSISGNGPVIGFLFTALAGPLVNLSIYGITMLLLTRFAHVEWVQNNAGFINSLRMINLWLGLFNLIPIPGTDGYNALMSLRLL